MKDCKYYISCGSPDNCRRCTGYQAEKKTKVKVWRVKYFDFSRNAARYKYFDSKDKAKKFYDVNNYIDKPEYIGMFYTSTLKRNGIEL